LRTRFAFAFEFEFESTIEPEAEPITGCVATEICEEEGPTGSISERNELIEWTLDDECFLVIRRIISGERCARILETL
jgi:hypothetical protein